MLVLLMVMVVIVVVVAFVTSVLVVLSLVLARTVALVLVLARRRRTGANRAGRHGSARDCHRRFRECIAIEGPAGQADGGARENGSDELRIRHRRRFGDPPVHVVASLPAGIGGWPSRTG